MIFKLEADKRIIDGFCAKNFYTDTAKDDLGNDIPNPESKDEFFQRLIGEYIKSSVVEQEIYQASIQADNDFKDYLNLNPKAIDISL